MTPLERSIFEACGSRPVLSADTCQHISIPTSGATDISIPDTACSYSQYSPCECSFHHDGENLQPLLQQITPERCKRLAEKVRKRNLEDMQSSGAVDDVEGVMDGSEGRWEVDESTSRRQRRCGVESPEPRDEGVNGASGVYIEDNQCYSENCDEEQTSSMSTIQAAMGFGGFATSRKVV